MKKDNDIIFYKLMRAILFMGIVTIFVWYYSGTDNFIPVLTWWVMLLLIGLAFMPVTLILFKRFYDNGWIFSKTIGIAVSSWLLWYLSSFKLLKFTRVNSVVMIVACAVLNIVIFKVYSKFASSPVKIGECLTSKKISSMINAEAIFFCVLLIWCYIKGFNPSAYGTEKFMDYGFITAILKSDYMPAHDLWFSGSAINYYYVGQYISAFLVKVSGVGAGFGYNLMMMSLAAFAFSLAYSIGFNVMSFNRTEKPSRKNYFAGLLSGLSLSLAGNMHFPIFKWIMPKMQRVAGQEVKSYWFADATRYIGYNPDRADKTIHEFPSYSFVLGDLHAHVINIIFVLTVVGVLFAWLLNRKAHMDISKKQGAVKPNYVKEIFSPYLLVCMFFIGLFNMTNFWDLPIYFCVCGSIILFSNLITYRYKKEAWILTGLQGLTFIVFWQIVALPFTLSFDSISTAIKFCDRHTLWYQFLVLWGLPLFTVGAFYVLKVREAMKARREISDKKPNIVVAFFDSLSISDLFVATIALCAIGLILIPEVVYVVDIYGGAYQRANTMFKLVYQAYMLFALAMSYIVIKYVYDKTCKIKGYFIVMLVLLCCTICYIFEACDAWFGKYYSGLDASAFIQEENEDDALGVKWINANAADDAVVLEMCGLSYSYFNRISVFTGNQTVLGWQTHEWLWRSSGAKDYPTEITDRHKDIITIYTSENVKQVRNLIDKYNISYIYVGEAEHFDGYSSSNAENNNAGRFHGSYYNHIIVNDALLKSLGDVITISPINESKNYETYIVKVDREKVINEEIISSGNTYKDSKPLYKVYDKNAPGGSSTIGYEYDESGNLTLEKYYDADGNLTEYYEYTLNADGTRNYGQCFDGSGKRKGFFNYVDFDEYGKCTTYHYFTDLPEPNEKGEDWKFDYTCYTVYYDDGSKYSETFTYNEKIYNKPSKTITYFYDNGILRKENICYSTGDSEVASHMDETITYTNDGEKITSATVLKGDGSTYTITYKY